jgi:hypothetical protein
MKNPLNNSNIMLNHNHDDEQEFGCKEQDEDDFNDLNDSYFDFDE